MEPKPEEKGSPRKGKSECESVVRVLEIVTINAIVHTEVRKLVQVFDPTKFFLGRIIEGLN